MGQCTFTSHVDYCSSFKSTSSTKSSLPPRFLDISAFHEFLTTVYPIDNYPICTCIPSFPFLGEHGCFSYEIACSPSDQRLCSTSSLQTSTTFSTFLKERSCQADLNSYWIKSWGGWVVTLTSRDWGNATESRVQICQLVSLNATFLGC